MSKREKCPKGGKDGEILPDKTERNDPKSLTVFRKCENGHTWTRNRPTLGQGAAALPPRPK